MNQGFWGKLRKPFFALAPMLDVTDSAFRRIVADCEKPDVFYTWFVSVDGLCSEGKKNILKNNNLKISRKERPLVVQLFGKDPEKFYQSAKIMAALGFDGIDINMGCPDKDILKQGYGAELMKDAKLAGEIIRATKKGAESAGRRIPVSVKTRIGYFNKNELKDFIPEILKEKPAAICIHGRTAKQRYGGEVDWKAIGEAAILAKGSGTLIIGNGDIGSLEEAKDKAEKYGLDGIMVGRAILKNPWMFKKNSKDIPIKERIGMLLKHASLFEKENKSSFGNFRKYLGCYVSGFDGSKGLRMKLMEAKSCREIKEIVQRIKF